MATYYFSKNSQTLLLKRDHSGQRLMLRGANFSQFSSRVLAQLQHEFKNRRVLYHIEPDQNVISITNAQTVIFIKIRVDALLITSHKPLEQVTTTRIINNLVGLMPSVSWHNY